MKNGMADKHYCNLRAVASTTAEEKNAKTSRCFHSRPCFGIGTHDSGHDSFLSSAPLEPDRPFHRAAPQNTDDPSGTYTPGTCMYLNFWFVNESLRLALLREELARSGAAIYRLGADRAFRHHSERLDSGPRRSQNE